MGETLFTEYLLIGNAESVPFSTRFPQGSTENPDAALCQTS
jgi:hypothetical protein